MRIIINTKGLKSIVPVCGSNFRMGFNIGSVMRPITWRILWYGGKKKERIESTNTNKINPWINK
jgi:hypothetical protein